MPFWFVLSFVPFRWVEDIRAERSSGGSVLSEVVIKPRGRRVSNLTGIAV